MVFGETNDDGSANESLFKDTAGEFLYNPSSNTLTAPNFNASTAVNTASITASAGFSLDVANDITLDAGGNNFNFAINGTTKGMLSGSGDGFAIKSTVSDGDLVFQGNDGGSAITAMTIDMSEGGNVGIGSTGNAIDELLHLEKSSGTTVVKTEVASNSTVGFEIKKTGSTTQNWRIVDGQTANGKLEVYDVTDSRSVMTFDGAGNVGIGTVSPAAAYGSDTVLEVSGASSPGLVINDTGQAQKYGIHADSNDLKVTYGSGALATFQNDGKVGIGTSSPTQKLDVRGGSGAGTLTHAIFTGTASRGLEIRTRSDTSGGQNSGTAEINSADSEGTGGDLAFSSNGNVRMFIDGGGNVGIGLTNPARRKLEIQDASPGIVFHDSDVTNLTHEIVGGGNAGLEISADYQNVGTGYIRFDVGGTERARITEAGHIQMANGGGIDFGLTANATGNLGSEILNDYEDGTWTPVLISGGSTNPTGGGALAPSGRYTKIGNRVWVTFYVGRSWTNSPSGTVMIQGLPYTIHASTNGYYTPVVTYNVSNGSSYRGNFIIPVVNSNTFSFYAQSASTWAAVDWASHVSSPIYFSGVFSYHV